MRLATLGLFTILLGVEPSSRAAVLPLAIQNQFRLGPPGSVVGAGFDAAGNLYVAGVTYGPFGGPAAAAPATATILGPGGGEADLYVMKIVPSGPLSPSAPQVAYVTGIATFVGTPCLTGPFLCTPSFPATVLFAGAAPQQVVGVDQINVKIPDDAIPGTAVRLDLQIAVSATAIATVAIK